MEKPPTLTDFLNLGIGHATDAYLRELAMISIQSHRLTQTVEKLGIYQRNLTEAEAPEGKLVEDRYFVNDNGTVTDQKTGLMWMQSPLENTFSFKEAHQAAQSLNARKGFAGHTDWRVPDQDELLSLVVESNFPTICQEAFPDSPEGFFWTSTPYIDNSSDAWVVYFSSGCALDLNRRYYGHVRLVR